MLRDGITRRSVLELERKRFSETSEWELNGDVVVVDQLDAVEKNFTIWDIAQAAKEGRLLEAFAVGTAALVHSVSQIDTPDQSINVDTDAVPHAALLHSWLSNIMYGIEKSGWTEIIKE